MTTVPFAATTPVHIGRVGLRARDARALANFYRDVIGLREISHEGSRIVLGVGDQPLLEITGSSTLKPDDPRAAGLFHTAFLLPSRAELARWVRHAIDKRIAVTGASDHHVSEALYLNDPEGNGIEIYADRPASSWQWDGEMIHMVTDRLNIDGLLGELGTDYQDWKAAPEGTIVGHVHLRVGNPEPAEEWWHSEMGFDTVARYGHAAAFLSSGGYHHHIGANSWQSAGAGKRDEDRTGLEFVELLSREATAARQLVDPWGNEMRVMPV